VLFPCFGAARFLAGVYGCDESILMGVFQAYFDESGKLADKNLVVFAGCVASVADWQSFSERWPGTLGPVRYIHMKEAMRLEGEFKHITDGDRDDLLVAAAELAVQRYAFSFHVPVVSAKFRALPDKLQQRLKDPVYCGFEGLLRNLANSAANIQVQSGREYSHSFQLYADSSEQYSVQILKLYHRLRMMYQDMRERFQSITFAEDEHFPPLQVADMIAYCRRCEEAGELDRPVLKKLLEVFNRNGSMENMDLVYNAESGQLGACGKIRDGDAVSDPADGFRAISGGNRAL